MSGFGTAIADISHTFGNDLDETPAGDIAIATGKTLTIQRIIRRLLTVATTAVKSSYPWEPVYGAGLPERIGYTINVLDLTGLMLAQMRQEAGVAPSPAPTVTIDQSLAAENTFPISVTYTDLSGTPQSFNFSYSP
jgi:hypothetical protein